MRAFFQKPNNDYLFDNQVNLVLLATASKYPGRNTFPDADVESVKSLSGYKPVYQNDQFVVLMRGERL
jgi:hypothetical protein